VDIDLSGAETGPWDLVASDGVTELHRLPAFFGVGEPPPEVPIGAVDLPGVTVDLGGNPKKVDFDSDGRAHAVYVDQTVTQTSVYLHTYSSTVNELVKVWEAPPNLFDCSAVLEVGPDDRVHVLFWENREPAGVVYQRFSPEGPIEFQTFLAIGTVEFALAVKGDGVAHIVSQKSVGLVTNLEEWLIIGDTVEGPFLVQENIDASCSFDLVACQNNGLLLTYATPAEEWLISDLRLQNFNAGSWSESETIWSGLYPDNLCMAWDGHESVLLAFGHFQNVPSPTLMTCKITEGVAGPVIQRYEEGMTADLCVAASGPNDFWLTTAGGITHASEYCHLRRGDGFTFYPVRRLDQGSGSTDAMLGAGPGGVFAYFYDFTTPEHSVRFYFCELEDLSATPDAALVEIRLQASPNPFNARTKVHFALPQAGQATLAVYDLKGRRVRTLLDGPIRAGKHSVSWDGRDGRGADVASGVYLYRLVAGKRMEIKRGVLVK